MCVCVCARVQVIPAVRPGLALSGFGEPAIVSDCNIKIGAIAIFFFLLVHLTISISQRSANCRR